MKALRRISTDGLQTLQSLHSQKCSRKHVIHSLAWPLVSAAGYTGDLQRALKKDACGQNSDVMQHGQPLLPSRPVHATHGKCDRSKLVLAAPEAGQ